MQGGGRTTGKEQGVRTHNRVRDDQEQSPRMRSKAGGGGNTRGQTKAGLPEKEGNQSSANPENSLIAAKRGSLGRTGTETGHQLDG